ncbi:thioesterase family protein [Ornithinimicrobium cryptoxanthini]|uniref:Thioesterase family protein n=1 Tax=Ornithinimicrobium cryptoxanthini TaxID=2934161 RepID=A0ABY4YH22_9MICO|nr:thioesterase family protein [Ornithinimicrobium cryptoxanthini]USQ76078.1 thioesterase family protein [Ornithinimicrobium cryptoxanthini]
MTYYQPLGDGVYRPTIHTQGAWQETEQHMGPASGLLAHALELHEPREDLQLARISFDILGMIHLEDSTIRTRTVRPGRTIELVEATMSSGGRDVIRASGWRLSTQDTSAVAGTAVEPLPGPERLEPWQGMQVWGGGYISSVEFRAVEPPVPGRARVWLHTEHDLVEGVPSTPLARFVGLVDTANGIAVRQSPREWLFPNTDLTIHFHRPPTGRWVGLDTTVSWGGTGLGVTSTVLHDEHGPVGHALQVLTVRAQ